MANFPGNPYGNVTPTGRSEADVIAKSIQLLAFEVRTANLQRQAAVVASSPSFSGDTDTDAFQIWYGLQGEIGTRLGVAE